MGKKCRCYRAAYSRYQEPLQDVGGLVPTHRLSDSGSLDPPIVRSTIAITATMATDASTTFGEVVARQSIASAASYRKSSMYEPLPFRAKVSS